jgi:hypothetical protein
MMYLFRINESWVAIVLVNTMLICRAFLFFVLFLVGCLVGKK